MDFKQACQVVHLLCEGMGIRAIERFTQLNRRTVLGILETAGRKCADLLDDKIRDVQCSSVQCDELYSYVFCKENKNKLRLPDIGEQYTYLGVDRKSKLILGFHIGKREEGETDTFIEDLRKRVKGQPQITTDGFSAYNSAISTTFGKNANFAQQVKIFKESVFMTKKARKALPVDRRCIGVKNFIRIGNPDPDLISTSHVERTNLSVRMFQRRYARLCLGFSKRLENMKLSVALFVAHFNFCRINSALKIKATETTKAKERTPAMAAGLTDHAWTVAELLVGSAI